jgi:hypothetical protein
MEQMVTANRPRGRAVKTGGKMRARLVPALTDAASSQFLGDFQTLISSLSTAPCELLITGDFNVHVHNPTDSNALKFISLLDLANLTQRVSFSTPFSRLVITVRLIGLSRRMNLVDYRRAATNGRTTRAADNDDTVLTFILPTTN